MDDILTRLRELLDGPVPMGVERQDVRDAAGEIERLRAQVADWVRTVQLAEEALWGPNT